MVSNTEGSQMISASLDLQKAVRDALETDAALVSVLGGAHFYDDVPPGAAFPYVTFGRSAVYDWSTDTESGREHLLTVHVWSRAGGKKETLEIMAAIEVVLATPSLAMEANRLVNLALEYAEARHEPDNDGYHGILRYRAVTEPLT